MSFEYIDKNVAEIRERIERARIAAGRTDEITLVAAVKYAEPAEIEYLYRHAGVMSLGENRVQQLLSHVEEADCSGADIHFIGSLQTNKVKYIIDKVSMIHSLDSLKLANEIDRQARKKGLTAHVLVEVNSGAEESKGGVLPDELEEFCLSLSQFSSIRLRGFMTMAPKCEKNDDYHKYFAQTYKLVLDIWTKKRHNISRPIISMGMSESYKEAVAEGSTLVRIGRALFVKD